MDEELKGRRGVRPTRAVAVVERVESVCLMAAAVKVGVGMGRIVKFRLSAAKMVVRRYLGPSVELDSQGLIGMVRARSVPCFLPPWRLNLRTPLIMTLLGCSERQ